LISKHYFGTVYFKVCSYLPNIIVIIVNRAFFEVDEIARAIIFIKLKKGRRWPYIFNCLIMFKTSKLN